MKKPIAWTFIATLILCAAAQAEVRGPDQWHTILSCHSASGAPSAGISLTITEGGFVGVTMAHLTSNAGGGPATHLGDVVIRQEPVQPGIDGAPLVYKGENFELSINVDGTPTPEGQYSHLYADLNGQVFNEPMMCKFVSR